jgi:hypothetical protein
MIMQACVSVVLPLCLAVAGADAPAARAPASPEQVRRVLAAVVRAAEENDARAEGRLDGDALADFYVRRAAAAAREEKVPPAAFLLALGVALDDTNVLRGNPVARLYLKQVESDAERKRRLRVVGKPTLRGRHDWVMHFTISAALTAHSGPAVAEQIGILKEVLDSTGSSGFSFGDLAADFAGIAFANLLLDRPEEARSRLRDLAETFDGNRYLPASAKDLEEDIPRERFQKLYGGTDEPRFARMCEKIRKSVLDAPGFRGSTSPP